MSNKSKQGGVQTRLQLHQMQVLCAEWVENRPQVLLLCLKFPRSDVMHTKTHLNGHQSAVLFANLQKICLLALF